MKSLSLYYYTFVDLLDFKDQVCELLTTMDACQIQLDIVSFIFNVCIIIIIIINFYFIRRSTMS